ncbi:PIG-P-domain-containing protein [Suhomyces tanzawaensis NRRL Y-17324]|uniref:PIG-P-domain-containing protein n=1 Tax=Suhomyces tanzawaensis NRRL Y-17324 TaxID=984487 RepID=A0A1E4SEX7_9ASCO|nr:PIG-P-domain-containing protein [Suhomyces tanzawaensis NRRL Y-17324]ODV78067.1 PIG-P-domain-containing protein [Suhomyces tanzawaensis NRRL Y-17324]
MSLRSRTASPDIQPVEDSLARQSDVTVSTNITPYAEYKGFFMYVLSALVLVLWTCWALLPEWFIQDYLSIHYYPDNYWSLAIPAYSLMAMLFVYIALALYNTEVKTFPLDDIRNFIDEHSAFAGAVGTSGLSHHQQVARAVEYVHKAPSGVWDLPITLVNEVLYSDKEST